MPEKPSAWGVPLTQRSYTLHTEGDLGPTDAPQRLEGHGLTSPNIEQSDPVTYTESVRRNGRNVGRTVTAAPARVTSIGYTITYPIRALWSPIMVQAQRGGFCQRDMYGIPDCIQDRQYKHWKIFKRGSLGPVVPVEDLMVGDSEDEGMIQYSSDVTFEEELTGWELGAFKVYTISGTKRANAISFFTEDCVDCDNLAGQAMVVVGGDATAAPTIQTTDDRFGTFTTVSFGAAGDTGKDVYSVGDLAVVPLYTGASFAAATAGKLFISTDRFATTPIQVTGLVDVIAAVDGENRTVFAVGKDSGGDAVLHYSLDGGQSWTASTSAALPTGSALLGAAWDVDTQRLYVVGEDGTLLLGTFTGSSLALTDISANLPGTPGDLAAVVALGNKTIFVGGAAGYAAESRDNGATWTTKVVAGTTAITSADGTIDRLVVGAGTGIYVRDVLRNNSFKAMTIEDGLSITGTVTDVQMGPNKDINLFSVTTSDGEIVILRDFRPA